MAERSLTEETPFDTKFKKWNKNFKGVTTESIKSYNPASQGSHLIQSLSYPEIQYDARDPTFIQRAGKDSDEIRDQFKPAKGVDAIAALTGVGGGELRVRAQTRMEDISQKRVENASPYIHEFEQVQKQLLEAVAEWKSATEVAVRVQAATRVGALQKQLAEIDEMKSKAMYPNMYVAKYEHRGESTRKKAMANVWVAAGKSEETPAAAAAKHPKKVANTEKGGYRLVHAYSAPVERTVALEDTR